MSRAFIFPDNALTLLRAQLNLNGRFTHSLRSAFRGPQILFAITVERGEQISVAVELGGQRHSTTLPDNSRNSACRLADFIDAIANGRIDSAAIAPPPALPGSDREQLVATMDETLAQLVRQGGFITLEGPTHAPVEVAVHAPADRPGITAILRMGAVSRCWTIHGAPEHCQRVLQSSLEALTSPQLAA
ncbi:MAG: hypothetical protein E6Q69_03105 [Aquipseudomonas alcaligenes]|uniref:Uncharacterized protein n=1 Tax=Aquipseudomonas alcaligenes TaxID=43263 RepID=A0A5C7W9R2_AQUAC|nr:MAG: hypothetical protein E6Q69_03105 [Pseudomonas alcaligenes]